MEWQRPDVVPALNIHETAIFKAVAVRYQCTMIVERWEVKEMSHHIAYLTTLTEVLGQIEGKGMQSYLDRHPELSKSS